MFAKGWWGKIAVRFVNGGIVIRYWVEESGTINCKVDLLVSVDFNYRPFDKGVYPSLSETKEHKKGWEE